MKTPISSVDFLSFPAPRRIVQQILVMLLCAMPLTAFAQTNTPSAPPPAAVPTVVDNISVTPKFGQTAQQLAADRADCQLWAKGQTGFDPTQPGGGVGQADYISRHQQFGRAMAACLGGHGYNVHFVAPPAPPPPSPPPVPVAPIAATPVLVRYSPPARPELQYHPFAMQIDGGYTATTGITNQELDGGANVGLGFSWFPTSALPIGIRVDGSYSAFQAKQALLYAGDFTSGHENLYGGDADVQLNLAHSSSASQFYLFGGPGWYREQTVLRQVSFVSGTVCGFFYCWPGYFPAITAEERSTSDWHRAWNAGLGWEIAIADRTSFFIEARYLRVLPNSNQTKFVPIRLGFRF